MKAKLFTLCLALVPGTIWAQLELLPDREPQPVFAGETRKITIVWHNTSEQAVDADLRTRLYQASSATAAHLSDAPWKKLQVLPEQTVIESALRFLPAEKSAAPP